MLCRISPVVRSYIRMRPSPVTTAIQSPPKVTASARAPSGRVMLSGKVRGGVRSSPEKRMTSRATMTTTPTIIVAVSTVTSRARNFNVAGLTGGGLSSMGQDPLSFRIGDDPPARLDKALVRDVPEVAALSRTRLARLLDEGAVRVNGAVVVEAKAGVTAGDLIEIEVPDARESHIAAEDIALAVIYEDDELIVVDKPAGMVVHPAPGSPAGTLVNALLYHCGDTLSGVGGARRPGIVHRIDKDTSGLLVVAKTDAAHQGLAAQFAAHSVERAYLAVVHGVPDPGDPRLAGLAGLRFDEGGALVIRTQLARHRTDRQRQAVVTSGGRHAVTRVRLRETFGRPPAASLVECRLETGRTHQIRVHMAYAGLGLIGDPVYGGARRLPARAVPEGAAEAARRFPRQALHAGVLGFPHPLSGAALRFASPLPADMAALLSYLRRADDIGTE